MPGQRELARRARAQLTDAVRLARWAEGPVSFTEAGRAAPTLELTPEQVAAAWDHARLAGLLELREGVATPGWRLRVWDRDDAAVLRGWVALFDAWSLALPAPEGADPGLVADVVEGTPQLLSLLHLTSGPLPVSGLLDLLTQRIAELRESRGEPDIADQADELPDLLEWLLAALASVGALHRDPDTPAVALTALGNWAVWTKLEQICVAAQSVAGHIEQPAEELLRACARYSPGPARAEYRAWLAARPVGQAVAELLEVARGDDPLLRGLAFDALRVVGGPAESAVRAASAEPSLRPYALLWLAELDGEAPPDLLSRQEATWLWVDTAAAVADHGEGHLLVRHLQSAAQGSVPQLLEELRQVDHPRTVQVLVALAAAHPDPVLAKVVRRAAFQVHSGGR
ncbi:hypothetical protein AQ490_03615 [Wenjunlia vitaminophila]|uniref:Uncharacterized protein n=2 Tax=Wenjunlia vitaminophila TaxID=76728 RepID=A0A0T6LU01_WENVI|nr:hypothetical protein AQ490_03615 [Wenjunlia vitaminophila]